jgi:glucose/arabinose dehydrogenase/cytochrome c553
VLRVLAGLGGLAVVLLVVAVVGVLLFIHWASSHDPFESAYVENCAVCHGEQLEGAPQGTPLAGVPLKHGDSVEEIERSIAAGFPARGMPAWSATMSAEEIQSLAIYIAERRVGRRFTDFKVDEPLSLPVGVVASELHAFRVETVSKGLDPLPYSIAPLPDGRILVTEKKRGLRIVSPGGESTLVEGTPDTGFGLKVGPLEQGVGWMLDVALHPDYERNGWIYLDHGDLCRGCQGVDGALLPRSMNRLVRGRIRDGAWVDEEVIWSADPATYTSISDMTAGGRIAFDDRGHVFLSVGIKGPANYVGIQDLALPYGKIHRVYDDGRIPEDNPFLGVPDALPSTWTYGHRSPQGLEFDRRTGELWGTEMGPRGGDEVNHLRPGRNYGWPLVSKGLDYDGTPVEYGKQLGIEPDLDHIEPPIVDLTPAPAVSSFVIYDGDAFPEWRGQLIVGTLKATELYRIVLDGDTWVHTEILLHDLARIRDVETAPDGSLYLLLEHASGGRIVRLVPAG